MSFLATKKIFIYTGLLISTIIMSENLCAQSGNHISHKVKKGETLYSLSRQYGVSVDAIRAANPSTEEGLKYGKTIKIPSKSKVADNSRTPATHTVAQGETLYSIAKKYGTSVDKLKQLNGLSDNTIKVGGSLKIKGSVTASDNKTAAPKETTSSKPGPETEESDNATKEETILNKSTEEAEILSEDSQNYVIRVTEIKGVKKVTELGLAEAIDESEKTETYLALHKTAPVGTVVQVTNELTKSSIFVRIIGRIPNIDLNNKLVIKISEKAFRKIGAVNNKHLVKLDYFLPEQSKK